MQYIIAIPCGLTISIRLSFPTLIDFFAPTFVRRSALDGNGLLLVSVKRLCFVQCTDICEFHLVVL